MSEKHPTNPAGVWFSITSSNLSEYRYSPKTLEFDVKFKNNDTVYRYSEVSLETVKGFQEAESKGSYFAKEIKTGHECRKLDISEAA